MKTGKLRIASQVAGVTALALGLAAVPAAAEQRRLLVTLKDGRQLTVTVDVAPGTPLGAIKLGDFGSPVVSVVEAPGSPTSGAPPAGTTSTTPTMTAPPTVATTPTTITATPTTPTTPSTTATTPPPTKPATGGVVRPKGKGTGKGGSAVAVDKTPGKHRTSGKPSVTDTIKPSLLATDEAGQQPTPTTPGFTFAPTGPQINGVPNFFIGQFQIPPFLLPIYQAAGMQYGVPWQILAAINEIETNYGRNLSVSTAGAVGWMQFMPGTWAQYGVDANGDGITDPYNPADAIFAAARYLKAAGAETDLNAAIFAYNHADWYVQSVLLRARVIGGMPADLVGSLTGLTEGHFPVAAQATYANSLDPKAATKARAAGANAAVTVQGDASRRSINIFARSGSPVIAVNDGRVVKLGTDPKLGRYVVLQDVYGNRYTYDHLGALATKYPVPRRNTQAQAASAGSIELPPKDKPPTQPATAGTQPQPTSSQSSGGKAPKGSAARAGHGRAGSGQDAGNATGAVTKERLFASPDRPAAYRAGGDRQIATTGEQVTTFKGYFTDALGLDPHQFVLKPLKAGSSVIAGTVLGRIGRTDRQLAPHVGFQIRPVGRGAPRIDPKPILDGWRLLESTGVYAKTKANAFKADAGDASIGQIMLMSKEQLQRRVLADPNLDLYAGGRADVETGQIDRRVLATLEYLTASGFKLQISALKAGHSYLTTSGNVSEHSSGNAVDIAAVNGIPITDHQGPGSITDIVIRRLLALQGLMKPHQIISLMTYPGTDNTLALPDHYNHIHVGFRPLDTGTIGEQVQAVLRPQQWNALMDQLNKIANPTVPTSPSKYALGDQGSGSSANGAGGKRGNGD